MFTPNFYILLNVKSVVLWSDLILIFLAIFSSYKYQSRHSINKIFTFYIVLILIGTLYHIFFNDNVLNVNTALYLFRASNYCLILYFLGRKIANDSYIIRIIFVKVIPVLIYINLFFALLQYYFPQLIITQSTVKLMTDDYGADSVLMFNQFRITGLFQGGQQLALSAGLLSYIIISNKSIKLSTKLLTCILPVFILIISNSRAVLFTTIILIIIVNFREIKNIAFYLLILFFSSIILYNFSTTNTLDVLFERYDISRFGVDSSINSGRFDRWYNYTLPAIYKNIFGYGTGFTKAYTSYELINAYKTTPLLGESLYLCRILENGIIFGGIFIIMSAHILIKLFYNIIFKNIKSETLVIYFTVISFLLIGLSSPCISAFPFNFLFALGMGIITNKTDEV